MYQYESPIGLFIIKKHYGKFLLIINDILYGSYVSEMAASVDVYCHSTGCYDWDILDCQIDDVPTDIYEWQYVKDTLI